ncbi:MAG: 4Fe-4S dicluster domain-containing protein [Syntrophobacteraceae bacterium]|nr:4Fe-4S dicluster domain-containing protein [Syntrophobacteraceae bacterium]
MKDKSQTRRAFFKNGLLVGIGAAGRLALVKDARSFPSFGKHRFGMIIDLNRCTGCNSCVIACKLQNSTAKHRFNTVVEEREVGGYPDSRIVFTPVLCNQCIDPPCAPACPQKATYKIAGGIVVTDWNKCTGAGDCVTACPYGARFLDPRFSNRVDKCDFCLHRLARGLQPACVEACPPRARVWGDFAAPCGEFALALSEGRLDPPKPELGIRTNVLYKRMVEAGHEK